MAEVTGADSDKGGDIKGQTINVISDQEELKATINQEMKASPEDQEQEQKCKGNIIIENDPDVLDEDLPTDFFDDFDNKDFLAGLDIVDAWEDETSESVPNLSLEDMMDAEMENESYSKQAIQANEHLQTEDKSELQPNESLMDKQTEEEKGKININNMDQKPSELKIEETIIQIPVATSEPESIKQDVESPENNIIHESTKKTVDGNNEKKSEKPADIDNQVKQSDSKQEDAEGKSSSNLKSVETDQGKPKARYVIPKRKSRDTEKEKDMERDREREMDKQKTPKEMERIREAHLVKERERARLARIDRRDPEKVKRDIQRDKAKCEKERISAKLQLVETGLVPPGTEMDVPDANASSSSTRSLEARKTLKDVVKRTSNLKRTRSRSPSPFHRKRRLSRSISPPVYRRRYSPPPLHRRRSRSRSPIYHRGEERRKRVRSPSPPSSMSRRHGRSPIERHASKHSREFSPEARKQSFLEELDHKLKATKENKMLENIKAQLNGTSSLNHGMMNPMMSAAVMPTMVPGIVGAPQMVPAPTSFHPAPVYDQQFFIGNNFAHDMNPYSNAAVYPTSVQPDSYAALQHSAQFYRQPNQLEDQQYESLKLFNDDNISFTEFLKITHRSTDNWQQSGLKRTVEVLNRCQDAMKLLSEMSRPNGRFYCNHNVQPPPVDKQLDLKLTSASPLKSTTPIRFQFTSKVRTTEERSLPAVARLMAKLGIKEAKLSKTSPLMPLSPAPPPPTIAQQRATVDHGAQTDEFKCKECTERKQRRMIDVGVQCEPPKTVEFGGQVCEEDFLSTARSALQSLLKKESFATMTPARLLAQFESLKDVVSPTKSDREEAIARPRGSGDFERRQIPPEYEYGRRGVPDYDRRSAALWNSYAPDGYGDYAPRPRPAGGRGGPGPNPRIPSLLASPYGGGGPYSDPLGFSAFGGPRGGGPRGYMPRRFN